MKVFICFVILGVVSLVPFASYCQTYTLLEEADTSGKALTSELSSYSSEELQKTPRRVSKTYKVLVPSDITKAGLKELMMKVVRDKTTLNKEIDKIWVFAYDKKEDATGPFTMGRLEWGPEGGTVSPDIARSNDRSSYVANFSISDEVGDPEVLKRKKKVEASRANETGKEYSLSKCSDVKNVMGPTGPDESDEAYENKVSIWNKYYDSKLATWSMTFTKKENLAGEKVIFSCSDIRKNVSKTVVFWVDDEAKGIFSGLKVGKSYLVKFKLYDWTPLDGEIVGNSVSSVKPL